MTKVREGHEGVAVLVGGSDAEPGVTYAGRIVRTHLADDDIRKIVKRAAVLRGKFGRNQP